MTEYGSWSVDKLRKELRLRGGRVTGPKNDLVCRLEAYDRNDDFRGSSSSFVMIPPAIQMPNWPTTGFRTLTTSDKDRLPPLTSERVQEYIVFRQSVDMASNMDLKAILQGQQLFDSVLALSFTPTENGNVLFSGVVEAAMKKRLSYAFKIRINLCGEVLNSHCECKAGAGVHATCKHIAAVLMSIANFIKTGTLSIRKSCTESLQGFHKPKSPHSGSPYKLAHDTRMTALAVEDPRPRQYRNRPNYQSEVDNLTTHFCLESGLDIARRRAIPKANLQAAVVDHAYLALPLTAE